MSIVRETEDEARAYADRLLSKLDEEAARRSAKSRSMPRTYGVQRQQELRGAAGGDGFVEDNLWTGIGRARSGCGAAIVGTPDQVLAKLRAYQAKASRPSSSPVIRICRKRTCSRAMCCRISSMGRWRYNYRRYMSVMEISISRSSAVGSMDAASRAMLQGAARACCCWRQRILQAAPRRLRAS
jgi:hypothetical protein